MNFTCSFNFFQEALLKMLVMVAHSHLLTKFVFQSHLVVNAISMASFYMTGIISLTPRKMVTTKPLVTFFTKWYPKRKKGFYA